MAALSRFLPNPLYKLVSVKLMHMGLPNQPKHKLAPNGRADFLRDFASVRLVSKEASPMILPQ